VFGENVSQLSGWQAANQFARKKNNKQIKYSTKKQTNKQKFPIYWNPFLFVFIGKSAAFAFFSRFGPFMASVSFLLTYSPL